LAQLDGGFISVGVETGSSFPSRFGVHGQSTFLRQSGFAQAGERLFKAD
jgi:hypothetical protein